MQEEAWVIIAIISDSYFVRPFSSKFLLILITLSNTIVYKQIFTVETIFIPTFFLPWTKFFSPVDKFSPWTIFVFFGREHIIYHGINSYYFHCCSSSHISFSSDTFETKYRPIFSTVVELILSTFHSKFVVNRTSNNELLR